MIFSHEGLVASRQNPLSQYIIRITIPVQSVQSTLYIQFLIRGRVPVLSCKCGIQRIHNILLLTVITVLNADKNSCKCEMDNFLGSRVRFKPKSDGQMSLFHFV